MRRVLGLLAVLCVLVGSAPAAGAAAGPVDLPGTWEFADTFTGYRYDHTATLLPSGKLLVTGGESYFSGVTYSEALLYDPGTGHWTRTGQMREPRTRHTATLLPNGQVLVIGGGAPGVVQPDSATAEIYDPATGVWRTARGAMSVPRYDHTATLLPSGKVLVVGGTRYPFGDTRPRHWAEVYDPATEQFTPADGLPASPDGGAAVALADGRVLLTGGLDGEGAARTDVYDERTGRFTETGPMSRARRYLTLTRLPSGRVLAVGGASGAHFDESALGGDRTTETFDPATGSWHRTADTLIHERSHSAVLLPDGDVLITGGETVDGGGGVQAEATSQRYDPRTDSMSRLPDMQQGHSSHTSTVLPSGAVLVVAGELSDAAGSERRGLAGAEQFRAVPDALQRRAAALAAGGLDLGAPAGAVHTVAVHPSVLGPSFRGRELVLARGELEWTAATGVHEVHGAIQQRYRELGGPGGDSYAPMGVPLTDEGPSADGRGRVSEFTNGPVYWTPWTGAHEVTGPPLKKYDAVGRERSLLGYPTGAQEGPGPASTGCSPDQIRPRTAAYAAFTGGVIATENPWSDSYVLHGAILDRYRQLGYWRCVGIPTSDEKPTADGRGRFTSFTAADIYWTPATGAHEITGGIRQHWLELGGARSLLGYPTSDESIVVPDDAGRYNDFAGGTIAWSAFSGAHEVHGAIRQTWAALGSARPGGLGYPTTDEYSFGGGRRSDFTRGYVTWDARTGRTSIYCPSCSVQR